MPDDVRAALEALLLSQAGMVSRRQLREIGLSDEWIEARLDSCRWQRVFRGTYATFTGPIPFAALVHAALLRAGAGAMACGRTAAGLDGLVDADPSRPIEVLLPYERRVHVESGIEVHYSREADRRRHPLKSPARVWVEEAVLDLAERSDSLTDVAGWVTAANRRMLTTPGRLSAALQDRRRHRWRRELIVMLADVEQGAQSPLELRYLRRVERAHRLPPAVRQRRVPGHCAHSVRYVDIDYDAFSTRVELDGRVGHHDDGAFRDRRRDNDGVRSGQATLRYGFGEVFQSPCGVAAEVATVLQVRGWEGVPRRCGPDCRLP